MAGPTPVSALIHAATMVTAGIYMIAEVMFFTHLPLSQNIVAIIGLNSNSGGIDCSQTK
jgi:NADH-quinone oxidoreductase subunit L